MNNEEMQRAMLLAQMNKRRELKDQYLHPQQQKPTDREPGALTNTVVTNLLLHGLRTGADVFGALRELRTRQPSADFNSMLSMLEELCDKVDCTVWELFIPDEPRKARTVSRLLTSLQKSGFDGWEGLELGRDGSARFELARFDSYWKMCDRKDSPVSLIFVKEREGENGFRYELLLGDTSYRPDGMIPAFGVLWQEEKGGLQSFTDEVLHRMTVQNAALGKVFSSVLQELSNESEKLAALCGVLEETGGRVNLLPVLQKELDNLNRLQLATHQAWEQLPPQARTEKNVKQVNNLLLLQRGAAGRLQAAASGSDLQSVLEQLSQASYLLESAGKQEL